ncbi:DUF1934 domain-containing protein [Liquorilactobacillus hordei]|uniref:DUF1934 domain-containing protein n=2 Tax=Liquorilactobacillus hordei TaxID=468911 RepID=A0A0R1MPT2_9LACO|nr:DUF1934 domain-containing protein [Liquorilactobacillus hordei]AUJ29167.1 hypothetical protein BSQ49_02475 [Liquorilactobacillus hordei]KRL06475.1 hypothetical protein FC92_GL000764 [Liquorilactobacillus hordei DSM 19519]MBZ2406581.1 DUF1934 domain-containing protein [Liquorilactobacillus hordei]QYH51874.1 DUF1934 domain-containing protein [Liquorilactobacillus hordei DSM 19519]
MSTGTDILITLQTFTKQDGEISKYDRKFEGQLFQMGNSIYLRYTEDDDKQEKAVVTFKINNNGGIQLTRKSKEMRMQLFFENNKRVSATYRTPYGEIPIETVTPLLSVNISDFPLVGTVNIDYFLYSGGNLLGEYKIRLQFSV